MIRRFLPLLVAAFFLAAAGDAPPVEPAEPVLGHADAPLTVIEYGSLTCPHCAEFEETILPKLKTDWIETGKIRFVFRDFPRDRTDLKAFQFVHCSGDPRFWGLIDALYRSQPSWVPMPDPAEHFIRMGKLAGLSEQKIRTCLADDALAEVSIGSAKAGSDAGVDGTPAFFLNGKKIALWSYEDWQKALKEAGAR